MKNNNKILYLTHTPPPIHGVSKISSLLYESKIINQGYQKRLIRLNLSTKISELRRPNIIQFLRFIQLFIKLLGSLLFYRPNLVYFTLMPVGFGFWKDCSLIILVKLFSIKIIYHIHNRGIPAYYKKTVYRFMYKLAFKKASIIHLSENLASSELLPFFKEIANIYVCSNSVPDNIFIEKKKSSSPTSALFFSNLFVHKGLKTLLKTIELLHLKKIDIKLVLAGAPTKMSTQLLEEFAAKKPELLDKLEIHEAVYGNEKCDIFNKADFFVFPSEFKEECMPLVILEALSAGLPVIASNIGAISTTVTEGENGFLIPSKNPESLALKIEKLIVDKELRLNMGRKSREIYVERYDVPKQEARMREIFLQHIKPST